MANLLDLSNRMQKLATSFDDRASAAAILVAKAVYSDLVQNTPVDTSQALSNWQVTLGLKAEGVIKPYASGSQGSTQAASVAAAIGNAVRVMSQKRPGEAICISNNLPYIKKLNDGSSSQQPAGFVERSVLVGRKTAERVKF